jgi:hypothetical protein
MSDGELCVHATRWCKYQDTLKKNIHVNVFHCDFSFNLNIFHVCPYKCF